MSSQAPSNTLAWADRVKHSTPSLSPGGEQNPSVSPVVEQQIESNKITFQFNAQQQEFSDSTRFFIIKTPNTFFNDITVSYGESDHQ
ncbi:hypothetical protein TNCV_3838261 [Trichonephila clavipes]|nr:hypothetical protein TNCV_3838261 [Trichonephila clavipes]